MPDVFTRIRLHGNDRVGEQCVGTLAIAHGGVPGRGLARAEEQQVRDRVVHHRIPHCAAAAGILPVRVVTPGCGGNFQQCLLLGRSLVAPGRITGHRPEAPHFLARLGVVCSDEATRAELAAGSTDEYLALRGTRRHRHRELGAIRGTDQRRRNGVGFPHGLARLRADGNQAPIQRAHVDLAIPHGNALVRIAQVAVRDLHRRVGPQALAVLRVEGIQVVARGGYVDHAIRIQRRTVLVLVGVVVAIPGQDQLLHIGVVDGGQRAEALLVVAAAVGRPLVRIVGALLQPRLVHSRGAGQLAGHGRLVIGGLAAARDDTGDGNRQQRCA